MHSRLNHNQTEREGIMSVIPKSSEGYGTTGLCTVPQVTVEAQFVAEDFLRAIYLWDGENGGFDYARFHSALGNA